MNLCYAPTEATCSVTVVAVFAFRPTAFFTDFFGPLRPRELPRYCPSDYLVSRGIIFKDGST
jgi:hypothetical protein